MVNLREELARVDGKFIHFLNAGYLEDELAKYKEEFEGNGFVFMQGDVSNIKTEYDLFDVIAKAMRFPDYFGRNWSALDDCLGDMMWLPANGYVLILSGSNKLWKENLELALTLLDIWFNVTIDMWRDTKKKPFHLIFEFEKPRFF